MLGTTNGMAGEACIASASDRTTPRGVRHRSMDMGAPSPSGATQQQRDAPPCAWLAALAARPTKGHDWARTRSLVMTGMALRCPAHAPPGHPPRLAGLLSPPSRLLPLAPALFPGAAKAHTTRHPFVTSTPRCAPGAGYRRRQILWQSARTLLAPCWLSAGRGCSEAPLSNCARACAMASACAAARARACTSAASGDCATPKACASTEASHRFRRWLRALP